jgi:23S rRNA pseudouridine1911/1915/1917 synthase
MLDHIEIIVSEESSNERIDIYLSKAVEEYDFSRTYIQKLLKQENITVNNLPIKQNYILKKNDLISLKIPQPEKLILTPENIPVEIIYQDRDIAIINKPAGMVVHPGHGNWNNTLVNALLYHISDLSTIGGVERPGIVHRLDKDTSGLILIAKNDISHRNLMHDFADRKVKKTYSAIVLGKPVKDHGIIELPIARHKVYRQKMCVDKNGRYAKTEYWIKQTWKRENYIFSMLDIDLHTGRTHQIRVHLSSTGNPVFGDIIYSKKHEKIDLMLASVGLSFFHPTFNEQMSFNISLPYHMKNFIDTLER